MRNTGWRMRDTFLPAGGGRWRFGPVVRSVCHPVAMRKTTIRLSSRVYQMIAEEARHEGVSTSQFIREAAFGRAWYHRGRRGARPRDVDEAIKALRDVLREEMSAEDSEAPEVSEASETP